MMRAGLLLAALLVAAAPALRSTSEAIALADQGPATGVMGRYWMTVATAEKAKHVLWLYSSARTQAPGTLTVSLSRPVASALKKKYDAPPETWLVGKHLVVDGAVRAVTIGTDTKRVVHEVWIYEMSQIVSIT